ncbi:MAG: molecular chaperone TorD family protein [Anaerolineales bacterium]
MTLSQELGNKVGPLEPSTAVVNNLSMQTLFRQTLYRLLCSVFLYPQEEMLADLQTGVKELHNSRLYWNEYEFADKLRQLISKIIDLDLNDRLPLVNEYNRLFLVKPKVPPYETTYLKLPGQSDGMIGAELSGVYGLAGLAVSPEMNELPDHVAVQLEFMSFLCEKELIALQNNDQEVLADSQQEQRRFLRDHLARWFPQFAKKALEEADRDSFYRQVVETTYAFLYNELDVLDIRLEG